MYQHDSSKQRLGVTAVARAIRFATSTAAPSCLKPPNRPEQLRRCGVRSPATMQGTAFLGPAARELGPGPLSDAAPRRAIEEFYDTHADPHQLINLAERPEHQQRLTVLRMELRRWLIESRDTGFLTL